MQVPGIELRGVTKRYGRAGAPLVIHGIDFTVPGGSLTTILGPSGCGKTTVLRMIAGLESPSAGQVLIDGLDVTLLPPAQRGVSMVFQSYALFPHMSVLDNVRYGLDVSGVAAADARRRAQAAMAGVGLEGFDARLPSELSGGQQQRVALARALVLEPRVLLFDEPLSNLDARLRRSMREEIRALQQRLNLTVAYVTHDQSEALAVSDEIIVMDAGRIAQRGTPQQLYERPASEFVAGFMGEAMLFDAQALGNGSARLGPLQLALPPHVPAGPLRLAVRPEAWRLSRDAKAGALEAVVGKSAYLGSTQELTVETALGPIFVVWPEPEPLLSAGERVWLELGTHGVSLVPR
ncbi:MAG: ATP-binding cassette domain-containing protein [Ideonella sp.]|nr:ATP-binding cassette domain-containing protein [Ideonella sp.]MCC7456238.1 ATP-binding cassette domain-containing protein [Nitrospira sp.]